MDETGDGQPMEGPVRQSDWEELRTRCQRFGQSRWQRLAVRANGRRALALARLSGAVCRLAAEIEVEPISDERARAVHANLREATLRLVRGESNEGWAAFHAARRASFAGVAEDRRRALAASVTEEVADKLTGWRLDAARKVLEVPADAIPSHEALMAAQAHIDERGSNVYRRLDLYGKLLWYATMALLIAIVAVGVAVERAWLDFGEASIMGDGAAVGGVAVLGALGSLLSLALSRVRSAEERLPQMIEGWLVALMRPVLGAASAIALVVVLESGIQSLVETDGSRIHVWAITAGFSERLLRRTLASVAESARAAPSTTEARYPEDDGDDGT